jgi:hypothetical protein
MFKHEEEHRRDHRNMKHFYYECLYDKLHEADTHGANLPAHNHIKAKNVKLHSTLQTTS